MRPGSLRNAPRPLLTWIAFIYLLTVAVAGAAPPPEGPEPVAGRAQIGPNMAGPERFALRAAYKTATRILDRDATCQALFDDLSLGGVEALGRSSYRQVRTATEQARCTRGAAAASDVGRSQILICQRFHTLRRPTKIAILIHEALHTAGLSEQPHDPQGMTSLEITHMVKQACSL